MKKTVCTILLTLFGWACLVNVCLTLVGRPLVPVPARYATIVAAFACLTAFHLAGTALEVLGRVGLVFSALPVFGLAGAVGFAAAGPVGAVVGFVVPLLVTLKWGLVGLAAMALAAVVAGFAVLA